MSKRPNIAIIVHSPYGHTAKVATHIAQGCNHHAVNVHLMSVEQIDWDILDQSDLFIMGCPTYMGNLTASMKLFMEQSSKRWLNRTWQGKWAAGFTNGGGLSGDKLPVLQQLNLFAMQHGMLWAGYPYLSSGKSEHDTNRLSCFLGLMTQSENASAEITPPAGDLKSARLFGEYLAQLMIKHCI